VLTYRNIYTVSYLAAYAQEKKAYGVIISFKYGEPIESLFGLFK
jgi:hypothetical protein